MSISKEQLVQKYNATVKPDGTLIFSQKLSDEEIKFLKSEGIKYEVEGSAEEIATEPKVFDISQEVIPSQKEQALETSVEEGAEFVPETKEGVSEQPIAEEVVDAEAEEAKRQEIFNSQEGVCEYWTNNFEDKDKKVDCIQITADNLLVQIKDKENNLEFKYIDSKNGAKVICSEDDVPNYEYFDSLVKRAKEGGFDVVNIKEGCTPNFQAKLLLACAKNNIEPIGNIPEDFDFEKYKENMTNLKEDKVDEFVEIRSEEIKTGKAKSYLTMSLATTMFFSSVFSGCTPRNSERIDRMDKKIDSLENVINLKNGEIAELEANTIDKRDTLHVNFIGCNGKMQGYSYFNKDGEQVFVRTDCKESKKGEVVIPTKRKKATSKKTTTVATKQPVVKKQEDVKPVIKIDKKAIIAEYLNSLKGDTIQVKDTITDKISKNVYVPPVYPRDTVQVDSMVLDSISNKVYVAKTDTILKTKVDTIDVKDGPYGEINLLGEIGTGYNGPKEASDSYSALTAELKLGTSKILKDSTKLFIEGRGVGGIMGNLRGKDLSGLDGRYATYLNEYAASIGAEIKDITIEATVGRQRLNDVTKKYTEMSFLDQIEYGHDAAYIQDMYAIKLKLENEKGQQFQILGGIAGSTNRGEFFGGPGKNGFVIASNAKNIFGQDKNINMDAAAGLKTSDGNVSEFATVVVHDYKNQITGELTFNEDNNPYDVQTRLYLAALEKQFNKLKVRAHYYKEDNFYKRVDTYGGELTWKLFEKNKKKLRNMEENTLEAGFFINNKTGDYDCYKCGSDGKLQYEKTNSYKNKINAGVKLVYRFGAKRGR